MDFILVSGDSLDVVRDRPGSVPGFLNFSRDRDRDRDRDYIRYLSSYFPL